MRGKKGVVDTTRLLRSKPFGEWVTVYYRPGDIGEQALLALMQKRGCPKAALVRGRGKSVVMNPYVAPGDAVQVRVEVAAATSLKSLELPPGWSMVGSSAGDAIAKGESYLWVQVPASAEAGAASLKFVLASGATIEGKVTVVRQVGKH